MRTNFLKRRRLLLPLILALGAVAQVLLHAHPHDPYHHASGCEERASSSGERHQEPRPAAPRAPHACAPCSALIAHSVSRTVAIPPPARLGLLRAERSSAQPGCVPRLGVGYRGPPSA